MSHKQDSDILKFATYKQLLQWSGGILVACISFVFGAITIHGNQPHKGAAEDSDILRIETNIRDLGQKIDRDLLYSIS